MMTLIIFLRETWRIAQSLAFACCTRLHRTSPVVRAWHCPRPHHAPKDWIAKFKGQFDMGWDKMREETLARQKAMGIVPPEGTNEVVD
jgi:hypothetical protein